MLATASTNSIAGAVAELRILVALKEGQFAVAKEQLAKATSIPKDRLARLHFAAGDKVKAEQLAQEAMKSGEQQMQPLANYVDLAYRSGKFKEAYDAFYKLRELSAEADLDAPVFRRLAPVAKDLKLAADWRLPLTRASDFGKRPSLASLGPFRWQPSAAPDFSLPDGDGKKFRSASSGASRLSSSSTSARAARTASSSLSPSRRRLRRSRRRASRSWP